MNTVTIDIHVDDEYVETIEVDAPPEEGDILEGLESYVCECCYPCEDGDADYIAECSVNA